MMDKSPDRKQMIFLTFLKARRWDSLAGYMLFIGMMAVGYYYNITLIQLGLVDLGQRGLGMSQASVANYMAGFALLTCVVAVGFGWWMRSTGLSLKFRKKILLAFFIVLIQTLLTLALVIVKHPTAYAVWIALTAIAIGIGVPVTFSMTSDLIPIQDRGYVAMAITALTYFTANVFPSDWTIEIFRSQMLWIMIPGVLGFAALVFSPFPLLDKLAGQHKDPLFARGRYVKDGQSGRLKESPRVIALIVLMFAIFFIDSLGFLRMTETPTYMINTWRSNELQPRFFIGSVHVVGAFIAGIFYTRMDDKILFLWIFGIFAIVHQGYGFQETLFPGGESNLGMPMLYALAVSMYTVANFAIWADISTPHTISLNTAIGVALSGWTATFLSTGLAIRWRSAGLPLAEHLQRVDALAWLLFLAVLALIFLPRRASKSNSLRSE
jgi:MFS family permease